MTFLPSDQTSYTNRDRLLPSQPVMRQFYRGNDFDAALERVTTSVLPIGSVHEKWDIRLKHGVTYETLGSDLSTLHFLHLLVRLTGATQVLEIGTYIGVSTLFLAEAVGPHGRVVTVEAGAEFAKIAQGNFDRNSLAHRIKLIHGNVAAMLPGLEWYTRPDLIFLDGAKAEYGELLQPLLDLLRPGGLMVVDDIFCQGDTLNLEPTTDKGTGVRDMLQRLAALHGYCPVILPYGDGQLLLRKP